MLKSANLGGKFDSEKLSGFDGDRQTIIIFFGVCSFILKKTFEWNKFVEKLIE